LFLAYQGEISFAALTSPSAVDDFFARYFPDVSALMPSLAREFFDHPTGMMGTVRCSQWSAGADMLLLGDAAHAITPFHGQGMNCALEDCTTLDRLFDSTHDWDRAIAEFDRTRRPDTDAIATMAIENYLEMRDTVRAPKFQLQKALSLELERRFPDRFVPRYSMVMFHHEIPYSVALSRGRIQSQILDELTLTAASLDEIDYDKAAVSILQRLPTLQRSS
jgi:kynurenine 3-monooxygenase